MATIVTGSTVKVTNPRTEGEELFTIEGHYYADLWVAFTGPDPINDEDTITTDIVRIKEGEFDGILPLAVLVSA